MLKTIALAALVLASAPAVAQSAQPQAQTIVAIPQIPATSNVRTPEGTAVEISSRHPDGLMA